MISKMFSDAVDRNMVMLNDDEYHALERLLGSIKKGGVVPIFTKTDYKSLEKRIAKLETDKDDWIERRASEINRRKSGPGRRVELKERRQGVKERRF